MEKMTFLMRASKQIELALENRCNERNVLDMRIYRHPYKQEDYNIFSIDQLDDAYEFVRNSPEWTLDIYENYAGEDYAESTDYSVIRTRESDSEMY